MKKFLIESIISSKNPVFDGQNDTIGTYSKMSACVTNYCITGDLDTSAFNQKED